MSIVRSALLITSIGLTGALTACGPHTISGRVIEGDDSYITIVNRDDVRLESDRGVPDVLLKLRLDPGRINRRLIAEGVSEGDGSFTLPVDEFGAGVIELEGGLLARRRGFRSAEGVFPLPSQSQRVLVVLAPGRDAPGQFDEEPTPAEQIRRFK